MWRYQCRIGVDRSLAARYHTGTLIERGVISAASTPPVQLAKVAQVMDLGLKEEHHATPEIAARMRQISAALPAGV